MKNKDYVVVTALSSYRMRYVMHRDDLQKFNPLDPVNAIEWANDTVNMNECEWTKDQKVAMVRKSIFLDEKIKNEQL